MGLATLGAGRAAQAIRQIAPTAAPKVGIAAARANAARALRGAARNAFTGAGASAIYGAAQPGDLQQRTQYAADSLGPGAVWGSGVPLAIEGGARGAVGMSRALGDIAPTAGGLASELTDTLRRVATGRARVQPSRQISSTAQARGHVDALQVLRQMGVTPETIEEGQRAALGKPITTAEAIGPSAIELAQGIRGRVGTTDAMANAVLGARAKTRRDRILLDTHEATEIHPLSILGDPNQLLAESGEKGARYLEAADQYVPSDARRLVKRIAAFDPKVISEAIRGMDPSKLVNSGWMFDDDNNWKSVVFPSVKALDAIKNQLQEVLEGQAGSTIGNEAQLQGFADQLQKKLTNPAFPAGVAYAEAHKFRGDLSSTNAALRSAKGGLLSPDIDPSSFENHVSTLLPFEQAAATAAGAGDLANLAYNQPFDASPMSDPATLRKMRMLFGERATEDLARSFGAEDAMAKFEQPPPKGLAGLSLRLRAAGQAPLNMTGRNALGQLLYQDPAVTVQTLRAYGDAPNAFDGARLRLPPVLQYGTAGLAGALQAPGPGATSYQP